jgi:hypothetical protein
MQAKFEQKIMSLATPAKLAAQRAMGEAYNGVVMANFGSEGFDRPWPWAPLSKRYAKRVKRSFATLSITHALKSTIKLEHDQDASRVSMANNSFCRYALAHHYGIFPVLPARRVFPIIDGQTTPLTKELVVKAARNAVERSLS